MTDPRGAVRLALANFPSDHQAEGPRLRELAETAWDAFAQEAESVIESGEDTPTVRYLLALFASRGCLAPYLGRLIQSRREIGRRTARLALRIDPDLDKTLAQAILTSQKSDASAPAQTALLEVLAETDRAENATAVQRGPREADDSKVRSRIALLVGRAARVKSWLRTLREDPDPGVRANAVEALWDQGGAFAAVCYDVGLQDPNHRVFSNSLIGLYRLGDTRSIGLLVQTASHPEHDFRASAVWAMGETCDARFVPFLWKFRRDPDAGLAQLASTACEHILSTQAAAERSPVVVHSLGVHLTPSSAVEARCVVLDVNRNSVDLLDTDWRPKSGHQPIWRYSVRQVDGLPKLAAVCLLPRSAAAQESRSTLYSSALREGLRTNRHYDCFTVAHYAEQPLPSSAQSAASEGPQPGDASTPRLPDSNRALSASSDLRLAVRDAGAPPPASSLDPGPLPTAAAALELLRACPGARHLIILADRLHPSLCDPAQAELLAQSAIHSAVSIHVLCTPSLAPESLAALFSLAIRTGGFNLTLDSLDSLSSAIPILVSAFARYYEISLPDVTSLDRLDLEIMSSTFTGHAHWTVDRETRLADPSPGIHWNRENAPPPACTPASPAPAL